MRGLVRGAPGAGGVIAQVFGLRGILTANKLSKFRVSELGSGAARTIRAERARAEVRRGGGSDRLNRIVRGTVPSYAGQFIYPERARCFPR